MAISIERAAQCPNRRVRMVDGGATGSVFTVDKRMREVQVVMDDGSGPIYVPADDLDWVSVLSERLRYAIDNDRDWEDAQSGFDNNLYSQGGEEYTGLRAVYTPGTANDDDEMHVLYVIAPAIRRVYPARITAHPDGAWEIEEILGWADA